MLFTGKIALRNRNIGEIGLSYMGGAYNKFSDDGLILDKKRRVNVYAIDFNTTIRGSNTFVNGEYAMVNVDIPPNYTEQFGRKQHGGFIDIVQPVYNKPVMGFEKSVFNIALRLEYVDWNHGTFKSTGGNISDHIISVSPALSWRPAPQTIFRFNYRHSKQKDLLGNPPSVAGAIQFGFSTYF